MSLDSATLACIVGPMGSHHVYPASGGAVTLPGRALRRMSAYWPLLSVYKMSVAGHPVDASETNMQLTNGGDITVTNPAACLSLMDSVEVKMTIEAPD